MLEWQRIRDLGRGNSRIQKKLITYIRESDYKAANTVKRREKPLDGDYEVLVDGTSKIFQIVINLLIGGQMKVLYLCCAYLTFSYPLSKLGDVLNSVGHQLKKGDIEHKERYYFSISELKNDSKVYNYLERDVDILRSFWAEYTKYLSYQNQEITAAATAYWDWLLRSQKDLEEIHRSIFGECFTFGFFGQKKGGKLKKYSWKDTKKWISPKHHCKKLIGQIFPSLNSEDDNYIRRWYSGGLTTLKLVQNGQNRV